jgi:hypothetical protein
VTHKVRFFPANDFAIEDIVNQWLFANPGVKIHKMYLSSGKDLDAKFWIWYEEE